MVEGLHLARIMQIADDLIEEVGSALPVLMLSAPQSNQKLHRIAFLKPLGGTLNSHDIVRFANIGPKPNLFHRGARGLLLALALLILKLAVVHDLRHGCAVITGETTTRSSLLALAMLRASEVSVRPRFSPF